jgi:hypothetical protein
MAMPIAAPYSVHLGALPKMTPTAGDQPFRAPLKVAHSGF